MRARKTALGRGRPHAMTDTRLVQISTTAVAASVYQTMAGAFLNLAGGTRWDVRGGGFAATGLAREWVPVQYEIDTGNESFTTVTKALADQLKLRPYLLNDQPVVAEWGLPDGSGSVHEQLYWGMCLRNLSDSVISLPLVTVSSKDTGPLMQVLVGRADMEFNRMLVGRDSRDSFSTQAYKWAMTTTGRPAEDAFLAQLLNSLRVVSPASNPNAQ